MYAQRERGEGRGGRNQRARELRGAENSRGRYGERYGDGLAGGRELRAIEKGWVYRERERQGGLTAVELRGSRGGCAEKGEGEESESERTERGSEKGRRKRQTDA